MWRERAARCGERVAAAFLELHGAVLMGRNVREGRDEIDLIALDRETIVFVEVRLRASGDPVGALRSVDPRKQERVARAACRFLARRGLLDRPVRFDVIGVTLDRDGSNLRLEHVRNAFSGAGRRYF